METTDSANPEKYQELTQMKGKLSKCGSGSQTEPSWASPGVEANRTRRLISRCETASGYASAACAPM